MTGAVQSVALGLVDQHLHHCVIQAAATSQDDGTTRLAEATRAIERLLLGARVRCRLTLVAQHDALATPRIREGAGYYVL